MAKKTIDQKIDHLTKLIEGLAEAVTEQFGGMHRRFDEVEKRLDRVEFLVSGQDNRISILEDRMRQVATKIGLTFSR